MKKIICIKLFIVIVCLLVIFVIDKIIKSNKIIVINIYYTGENDNAKKFAEEMEKSGIAETIRAEAGNLKYEYFYPKNDKESILLIDIWKNQKALDIHHNTPMMKKIAELREKYDLHMIVEKYNSSGNFRYNEKFIRK